MECATKEKPITRDHDILLSLLLRLYVRTFQALGNRNTQEEEEEKGPHPYTILIPSSWEKERDKPRLFSLSLSWFKKVHTN